MKVETDVIWKKGPFKQNSHDDLDDIAYILTSCFVLTLKNVGSSDERAKARSAAQRHRDPEKSLGVYDNTTCKNFSFGLILSCATITGYALWTHDIDQASIRRDEPLRWTIYLRPLNV